MTAGGPTGPRRRRNSNCPLGLLQSWYNLLTGGCASRSAGSPAPLRWCRPMHELTLVHTPPAAEGQPGKVRVEYRADPHVQPQTAEVPFAFEYDPKDRRLVQWYLEEYFTCPWGVYKERAALAEKTIRDLGEQLFKAVFGPEDTRDLYAEVRKQLADTRIVVHATSPIGAAPAGRGAPGRGQSHGRRTRPVQYGGGGRDPRRRV
jgi:hypothetical protein